MAIPWNITSRNGVGSAANLLFERLPERIFAPLASPNRQRYWALLCTLHANRFGPDAPLPPSKGFAVREILQDIQDELLSQDSWENEDGQPLETDFSVRAHMIFNRLSDSGWFRMESFGLEKRVTMRPAVSKFLTFMVSFAETGPVFVSGKIRSIELNIQQVLDGQADGDTLSETADQARSLMEHVRNTGTTVRDIMDSLSKETATAQYVRLFFNQYIENVFIGDYRELRTKEHPLSRRPQILRAVGEIQESEQHRARLIGWYESRRCAGDRRRAEMLFERDIQRLQDLRRIDEYLERLDDEIRMANRRALAYLEYRLRSLRPVDHMVKQAIEAVLSSNAQGLGDPFPVRVLVSGEALAEPRKHIERPAPSNLRRHVPSERELAKSRVMLRAQQARSVSAPKLAEYVRSQLDSKEHLSSEKLNMESVSNVRNFQALSSISMAMSADSRRLMLSAMTLAKGFRVRFTGTLETQGNGISGRPFIVESRKATAGSSESKK
ncbi:Wadjet anti-phage system protein JetA family protein [Methylophilus sp. TWE2]|uniref:Wadjet anti-phage system protein JetA family protein n=1 Tax=Methylophilus sp. TWE2 TaxID=1662285 RepID=UPI000670BAC7|nr:Wadjet anti-phage system protein JetA family protein [Methylophilus sp. TWE2]